MNLFRGHLLLITAAWIGSAFLSSFALGQTQNLDIAPFARRCCVTDHNLIPQIAFDYTSRDQLNGNASRTTDGRYIYGLQWSEARDIQEIVVRFRPGSTPVKATVEYWSLNWPDPPPKMPTIEDPEPDPWQGQWLTATTSVNCSNLECHYTFQPLAKSENPRADNLPGLAYRRTLKFRLVFSSQPAVDHVQVFSGSTLKPTRVRVELGAGESVRYEWQGDLKVYNGALKNVELWNGSSGDMAGSRHFHIVTQHAKKGFYVDLLSVDHALPGSEDVTIVTLNAGQRAFSFAVPDLDKGPIYIPDLHTYISRADDPKTFSPSIVIAGGTIREKVAREPEQTYERASKEIPPLDPTQREADPNGPKNRGYLYLPLAADASWQKFAFEWGGNIHISKAGTKAKGAELRRLEWTGDDINWRLGTGAEPTFRPDWHDSSLQSLDDVLPVAVANWSDKTIHYTEEGFSTLLSGPLSPDDPGRSEETPAVLLIKLVVENTDSQPATSHLWFATAPDEAINYENGVLTTQDGHLVRAFLKPPDDARVALASFADSGTTVHGIHIEVPLQANQSRTILLSLPFIPRLTDVERVQLRDLNYDQERARIVDYWQKIVAEAVPFKVPEEHSMKLAIATVPHERVSITKDPKSGLYMVPAASYDYGVFANVGAIQCTMFDLLGHSDLSAKGLETFVQLQGNRPMIGTYSGDQKAVYNGARIDAEYDYTAGEYNLNHGAALQGLAAHYFFTRDKAWFDHVSPGMKRAADWIIEQRKLTQVLDAGQKIPEYGLLPADNLEDNTDWGHWFGVNAEAVRGMEMLADALKDVGAPEAAHYADEAAAYKSDLRDAVLRAAQVAPVVRLQNNTYIPYVGARPYQRIRHFGSIRVAYYSRYPGAPPTLYRAASTRENFAGPILLLLRDVFRPNEPVADWILDDWEDNLTVSAPLGINVHGWVDPQYWFSQGGINFESLRNTVMAYLKRNEIPAAIRSHYNSFVATYYPVPNVFTEEIHQWVHGAGPFYKTADEARFVNHLRGMLVREDGDTLWLAAGTPTRWLEAGKKIEVNNAPTYFGPVSYTIEGSDSSVHARVILPSRNAIKNPWLVLRLPGGAHFQSVELDGKPWQDFDAATQRIRLPVTNKPIDVSVRY